jgi:SAM-dependent methyltransferase
MTDLSRFQGQSFDLVIHPVANVYIPDVTPLWAEVARVLRPGGVLVAGFFNPAVYVFDQDRLGDGELVVAHSLPYSELASIDAGARQRLIDDGDPLQFSHTLADQIGGQGRAGLHVTDLLEDRRPNHPLAPWMPTHLATRAVRQG